MIILGLFVVFVIVNLVGWWLVPIIAVLIGALVLNNYAVTKVNKKRSELVTGICLLVFAVLFTLFYVFYMNRKRYFPEESPSDEPIWKEEVIEEDTSTWEPPSDTASISVTEKTKIMNSNTVSSASHSYSYDEDDDNMRGFDPASEDDMDDNGMSRYMEANDDEGWD